MFFNRGAAEPLGAVKGSKGAANFLTLRLFTYKLSLGVPPNCSITKKECRESKKVENHWYGIDEEKKMRN